MPQYTIPGRPLPLSVGKIIGIGRNYADHVAEMGSEVPSEPLLFFKPSTAVIRDGGRVVIPPESEEVHHEVELVVAIGTRCSRIAVSEALDAVAGYAVGLDMTARDFQRRAKRDGTPWAIAKGFDTSAPLGDFVPASQVADPQNLRLRLEINGKVRQDASTALMLVPVARLISYASKFFTLEPGDLIYTGSPEGVGPVRDGDRLVATLDGRTPLRVSVVQG